MTIDRTAARLIDDAIDHALDDGRIVGTVVLLARKGKVIHARAAGHADRESGQMMTRGTWFRYASVSKAFTTVAALRLMAQGRLSPNDPVTRHLPGFTPALPDGSLPRITIDHLLSHTAGLDYGFNQPDGGTYASAGVSDGISESRLSLAENLRRIASVPLGNVPGAEWRYSVATDVLGAVIEATTGQPLPAAISDLVTGTLGLEAGFHLPDSRNLAVAYADARPKPRRMSGLTRVASRMLPAGYAYRFDPDRIFSTTAFPSGGGGMAGTADAALQLLETLRCGTFLDSALRMAAAQPRCNKIRSPRGPGWNHAWAGAVLLDPLRARSTLSPGSLSWGGIYGHSWWIDPARERTLVAFTNTAVEGMNGTFAADMARAVAA